MLLGVTFCRRCFGSFLNRFLGFFGTPRSVFGLHRRVRIAYAPFSRKVQFWVTLGSTCEVILSSDMSTIGSKGYPEADFRRHLGWYKKRHEKSGPKGQPHDQHKGGGGPREAEGGPGVRTTGGERRFSHAC